MLRALLDVPTARAIVRKSGVRLSGGGGGAGEGLPEIWGSFALMETGEAAGYVEEHGAVTEFELPDAEVSMRRLADWGERTEARLFATVTQAANAGATLEVEGEGITFSGGLSVPLDSLGEQTSAWKAAAKESEAIETRWYVKNPSGDAGAVGLGLCQLQVR